MIALTEQQIRASFVNASRREAATATLPDLDVLRWDRLEYLGWRDRKAPLAAYAVVELDGGPTGIRLRSTDPKAAGRRRRAQCAWCEDIVVTDDVSLYVARRAGAAGRRGDSVGTLICTEFGCSANVRRPPTSIEVGDDPTMREYVVEARIAGLRERAARFVTEVLRDA
ncbi:FBP domain-containing protein [Georgenia faecalis]|uniref:FBP domain-containing protein n=1 Tax=Georgenia faecalis TaxID=2483799 RepID=A0ABV9D7G0_9MICO|nr:FBP domain-containing protein [Georgenia faecalis]